MRRLTVLLVMLALLCTGVGRVEADLIQMDFEEYSDQDDLNGWNLGGVTLTGPNGLVEVFDNRFGALYHSATKSIACPDGVVSLNPLVGTFDYPVTFVSLWGGDAGTYTEADSWELRAYDAPTGGNLVGSAASGSWNGYPYRRLEVTADLIWRFEAVWTGPENGIAYDDLSFGGGSAGLIPEPSLVVLAAAGLLLLLTHAGRRRALRE